MLKFRIQSTPNPTARKYILSEEIKAEGKISYREPEACTHIPLVNSLLNLNSVRQVHLFQNVVTITQDGSQAWMELDSAVQTIINETFEHHDPYFIENLDSKETKDQGSKDPKLQKIDSILDQTIRPHLQMDGGDIELVELEGDILTLRYLGACGGCPSSMTGTLEAIRSTLNERYSENLQVVAL